MKSYINILTLIFCLFSYHVKGYNTDKDLILTNSALAENQPNLLLFSTLGGGLVAVDQLSGEMRWSIEDEPPMSTEADTEFSQFLPNPKDGSLYQVDKMGDLKKMPYTVPQLVARAPCRSSNGIIYSGKKSDVWFLLDLNTGNKEKVMGFIKTNSKEEVQSFVNQNLGRADSNSKYFSRTQYSLMIFDSLSKDLNVQPWNITFYVYFSDIMAPRVAKNYKFIHLTASSSGSILTLSEQGHLLWQQQFKSPVVSIFLLQKEGVLNIPFTTVADNILKNIIAGASDNIKKIKLLKSYYIGQYLRSFYVLPSLIDKETISLTSTSTAKLLEGTGFKKDSYTLKKSIESHILDVGHYDLHSVGFNSLISANKNIETEEWKLGYINLLSIVTLKFKAWLCVYQMNVACVSLLFIIFIMATSFSKKKYLQRKPGLSTEKVRVGKISFDPKQILGKGCDGTCVFKGTFEQRDVAVKRMLPQCYSYADREVALLKESDMHANVVRYYCTEEDSQFRYIALELCASTLQHFTEDFNNKKVVSFIDPFEILKQATRGLSHLHSLNIVHRDIKPQNVLLSFPDSKNMVRAMISDFGLCKKVCNETKTFSQRSGIAGTEGWIAPEIILCQKASAACDIFSLGCVYFYVLTGGRHAFGTYLQRQSNILANKYSLLKLKKNKSWPENKMILAEQLIEEMIHFEPNKRPSAISIGSHPLFWNENKILTFLQEVSDRIEKLSYTIEPLKSLEKNCSLAINNNWYLHLEEEVNCDLKKYRAYSGTSVRDLLRALRNKKHHFNELPIELKKILGNIPNEFAFYWTSRFPYLLQHVYHSLSSCSCESTFENYYSQSYIFKKPTYFDQRINNEIVPNIGNRNITKSKEIDFTSTRSRKIFHQRKQKKK